ncbi:MAG: RteC domain-containing protein [Flavobacteriales bacterium]|nr:RteC domain-containing protein [Flavobacteriales bacterium]
MKSFFDDNLDFYRYFRTSSTYLDHKYFVRGRQDIRLRLDSRFYKSDPSLRN